MPFKSEAQRRWMYAAEARGEVPEGTASRWQDETPKGKKLPEKVKKKKGEKKTAEELILGGLADYKPDRFYAKDQVRKGIKVELEHVDDKAKAKEIAKDHLEEQRAAGETQNYYDKLLKMEGKKHAQEEEEPQVGVDPHATTDIVSPDMPLSKIEQALKSYLTEASRLAEEVLDPDTGEFIGTPEQQERLNKLDSTTAGLKKIIRQRKYNIRDSLTGDQMTALKLQSLLTPSTKVGEVTRKVSPHGYEMSFPETNKASAKAEGNLGATLGLNLDQGRASGRKPSISPLSRPGYTGSGDIASNSTPGSIEHTASEKSPKPSRGEWDHHSARAAGEIGYLLGMDYLGMGMPEPGVPDYKSYPEDYVNKTIRPKAEIGLDRFYTKPHLRKAHIDGFVRGAQDELKHNERAARSIYSQSRHPTSEKTMDVYEKRAAEVFGHRPSLINPREVKVAFFFEGLADSLEKDGFYISNPEAFFTGAFEALRDHFEGDTKLASGVYADHVVRCCQVFKDRMVKMAGFENLVPVNPMDPNAAQKAQENALGVSPQRQERRQDIIDALLPHAETISLDPDGKIKLKMPSPEAQGVMDPQMMQQQRMAEMQGRQGAQQMQQQPIEAGQEDPAAAQLMNGEGAEVEAGGTGDPAGGNPMGGDPMGMAQNAESPMLGGGGSAEEALLQQLLSSPKNASALISSLKD